jgi:hypothetical protein
MNITRSIISIIIGIFLVSSVAQAMKRRYESSAQDESASKKQNTTPLQIPVREGYNGQLVKLAWADATSQDWIEVPLEEAKLCVTIKNMLEDLREVPDYTLPLHNITLDSLKHVVKCLEIIGAGGEVGQKLDDYVEKLSDEALQELLLSAGYLDIKLVLDVCNRAAQKRNADTGAQILSLDEVTIERIVSDFIQDIHMKTQYFSSLEDMRDLEIQNCKRYLKKMLVKSLKNCTLTENSLEEHVKLLSLCLNTWNFRHYVDVSDSIEHLFPLSQEDLMSMIQLGKFLEAFPMKGEFFLLIIRDYLTIRSDFRQKSDELFKHIWDLSLSTLDDHDSFRELSLQAACVMREVKEKCLSCENIDQLQKIIVSYENWKKLYNLIPTPVSSAWNSLFPGYRIPQ